ncbi:MAG TPA: hypothetical protein VLF43_02570 [Candidatus Saccharimonadales bacterium]|nr:hypothetical protein [Candidatus Saccharimonadales bacterium]
MAYNLPGDLKRFNNMFEYARGKNLPHEPGALVVFGRDDARIAHRAGQLVQANLAEVAVFTSEAQGSDAGTLAARGFRNAAHFSSHEFDAYCRTNDVMPPTVLQEENATNDRENARFSLDVLAQKHWTGNLAITGVTHATFGRRLGAILEQIVAEHPAVGADNVCVAPSHYGFSPINLFDREDVSHEILDIAGFSADGRGVVQHDLPIEYVDFAGDYIAHLARTT